MFFTSDAFLQIGQSLDEYFLAPANASRRLERLANALGLNGASVIGAPDAPLALLQVGTSVKLIGTMEALRSSPFARELGAVDSNERQKVGHRELAVFDVPRTENTARRLDVPRVLLVNLFHREMYPTPRLTLGTAYIAAHLRERHVASVSLRDFQFPFSISDLLNEIANAKPQIVGLSANFGQLDILQEVLVGLENLDGDARPVIALGNILPAMSATSLIERFPYVIICQRDGELMMEALARGVQDQSTWHNVPGAVFRDRHTGKIVRTAPRLIDLDLLPPPALDSVQETLDAGGVITAEFSRGCHYNVCSFCPRSHKASSWRGMTATGFSRHLRTYAELFSSLNYPPYIFLADEEFIGAEPEGFAEHGRVNQFLRELDGLPIRLRFDAATRADQAFSLVQTDDWHRQRGALFKRMKASGLSRLFIGVESGSDDQLKRYNKGTEVATNASALRYLSMLGIKLRFGFITFDPLMSAEDLCENIEFMARRDIVLPSQELELNEIFQIVRDSHGKQLPCSSGRPVFEEISYVASPLEVLLKSRYLAEVRAAVPDLVMEADPGFARVDVRYREPLIQLTSELCQRWINHCFPVVYTLKGLQKTSQGVLASTLAETISTYRGSTFFLLRALVSAFGLADKSRIGRWEAVHASPVALPNDTGEKGLGERGEITLRAYDAHFRERLAVADMTLRAAGLEADAWNQTYEAWLREDIIGRHGTRLR